MTLNPMKQKQFSPTPRIQSRPRGLWGRSGLTLRKPSLYPGTQACPPADHGPGHPGLAL